MSPEYWPCCAVSGKTIPFLSWMSTSIELGLMPGIRRSLIRGEVHGRWLPYGFIWQLKPSWHPNSFQRWFSFSLRNNHLQQNLPLCSVFGPDLVFRGCLLKDIRKCLEQVESSFAHFSTRQHSKHFHSCGMGSVPFNPTKPVAMKEDINKSVSTNTEKLGAGKSP